MRTGRQEAALIAARLLVAAIERVVLDVAHVAEAEAGKGGLGDRVLIAVRVLGGAGDAVDLVPVPVVDGARELGVLPAPPRALAPADDGRAHDADGMLSH